eukprot:12033830-Prorocentrum_lima.AAC.1
MTLSPQESSPLASRLYVADLVKEIRGVAHGAKPQVWEFLQMMMERVTLVLLFPLPLVGVVLLLVRL